MGLEVGNIVEGKVTGITNFGAFIELEGGKTGLVHISEVAREYVKDIKEHLKDKQVVKVKVLSIENGGKISLSIKKACDEDRKAPSFAGKPIEIDWSGKSRVPDSMSFEDKMARFKQDSDEKLQDIRRNSETVRRSAYKRSSNSF